MTVKVERTVTFMGPPLSPEIGQAIPLGLGVSMEQLYGPSTDTEIENRPPYLPRSTSTVSFVAEGTFSPDSLSLIARGLGATPADLYVPTSTPDPNPPVVEIPVTTTPDYEIKQGATFPPMVVLLRDRNGPYDLTGCTVRLIIASRSGGPPVIDAPVMVNPNQIAYKGQVIYSWAPADTANAGQFVGEFSVVSPSGVPLRFPSRGNFTVGITPQVGGP